MMTPASEITALDLLERAKVYLVSHIKSHAIYYGANPKNYLSSWASNTVGYKKLRCIQKRKMISKDFLIACVRSFIGLGYQNNFNFVAQIADFKNPQVTISWCHKEDFLEDGSFQCRYYNKNSKETSEILWFLISLDNFIPDEINNNIAIFTKKISEKFSIINFFKNFIFCLQNRIPFLVESVFAKKLSDTFINNVNLGMFKQVLFPYEAQPWQHTLSLMLKKISKDIFITGDLHSCLPPLPTDFIKRYGAPDKVIVHGQGQKDIMVDLLGWNKKEIEISPSQRLTANHDSQLSNKILLPYTIGDSEIILKNLEYFFHLYHKKFPFLDIRNHPVRINSREHNNLIQEIRNIQATYLDKTTHNIAEKVSLVIGASSVIIECLTRGIKVFQITDNALFESYDSLVWKGITTKYINDNIVEYILPIKIKYLDLNRKTSND